MRRRDSRDIINFSHFTSNWIRIGDPEPASSGGCRIWQWEPREKERLSRHSEKNENVYIPYRRHKILDWLHFVLRKGEGPWYPHHHPLFLGKEPGPCNPSPGSALGLQISFGPITPGTTWSIINSDLLVVAPKDLSPRRVWEGGLGGPGFGWKKVDCARPKARTNALTS